MRPVFGCHPCGPAGTESIVSCWSCRTTVRHPAHLSSDKLPTSNHHDKPSASPTRQVDSHPITINYTSPTRATLGHFTSTFYIFTNILSQRDLLHRKIRVAIPGENQLRHSRVTQPTVHAGCLSVSIIHQTLTWTTGSLTCGHINACNCTWWYTDTGRESTMEKKNPLPHRGIEPASAACRFCAPPTELHPRSFPSI